MTDSLDSVFPSLFTIQLPVDICTLDTYLRLVLSLASNALRPPPYFARSPVERLSRQCQRARPRTTIIITTT